MRRLWRTLLLLLALLLVVSILLGLFRSRVVPYGREVPDEQLDRAAKEIMEELTRLGRSVEEAEAFIETMRCSYRPEECDELQDETGR